MLLDRVRRAIREHGIFQPGDRVVAAVSGGPDSVALADLLHRLAPELNLQLHLFHLHHGLRGAEADADAAYTEALARQWGLPCTIERADATAAAGALGGIEAAGRELRYRALARLAARWSARCVATGHHRDDQAETVLLRLLRGAGRGGLAGMRPVRPLGYGAPEGCMLVRPLLDVSRAEIAAYCQERGLQPRQDASNYDLRFLRNRIRHQLLPLLAREYNGQIYGLLADLAEILRAEEEYLESAAEAVWARYGIRLEPERAVEIPRAALVHEHRAVARRLLRRAAAQLGGHLELAHTEALLAAAQAGAGSVAMDLPGALAALVEYGSVRLSRAGGRDGAGPDGAAPSAAGPWPLAVPGLTEVPELGIRIRAGHGPAAAAGPWTVALDPAALPGPLEIRTRRPGDRIWPVGMEGSKKLQDLLVDLKVPRARRDRLPVVAAGDQIVWLPGIRADRRCLARPQGHSLILTAELM